MLFILLIYRLYRLYRYLSLFIAFYRFLSLFIAFLSLLFYYRPHTLLLAQHELRVGVIIHWLEFLLVGVAPVLLQPVFVFVFLAVVRVSICRANAYLRLLLLYELTAMRDAAMVVATAMNNDAMVVATVMNNDAMVVATAINNDAMVVATVMRDAALVVFYNPVHLGEQVTHLLDFLIDFFAYLSAFASALLF